MSEPYAHQEFPKVLYRKGKTLTVADTAAEAAAVKGGWLNAADRTPAELPAETAEPADAEPAAVNP